MYEEFMHEEAVDWLQTNFNPAALASGPVREHCGRAGLCERPV